MARRVSVKGKGADIFFGDYEQPSAPHVDAPPATQLPSLSPETLHAAGSPGLTPSAVVPKQPRGRPVKLADTTARQQDSKPASVLASTLASDLEVVIQTIRKTVKLPGREVSFVRLTPEEKRQLIDIVYVYKRQGTRTSENEINRIAVNYILEDYRANGAQSILARVIDALLA